MSRLTFIKVTMRFTSLLFAFCVVTCEAGFSLRKHKHRSMHVEKAPPGIKVPKTKEHRYSRQIEKAPPKGTSTTYPVEGTLEHDPKAAKRRHKTYEQVQRLISRKASLRRRSAKSAPPGFVITAQSKLDRRGMLDKDPDADERRHDVYELLKGEHKHKKHRKHSSRHSTGTHRSKRSSHHVHASGETKSKHSPRRSSSSTKSEVAHKRKSLKKAPELRIEPPTPRRDAPPARRVQQRKRYSEDIGALDDDDDDDAEDEDDDEDEDEDDSEYDDVAEDDEEDEDEYEEDDDDDDDEEDDADYEDDEDENESTSHSENDDEFGGEYNSNSNDLGFGSLSGLNFGSYKAPGSSSQEDLQGATQDHFGGFDFDDYLKVPEDKRSSEEVYRELHKESAERKSTGDVLKDTLLHDLGVDPAQQQSKKSSSSGKRNDNALSSLTSAVAGLDVDNLSFGTPQNTPRSRRPSGIHHGSSSASSDEDYDQLMQSLDALSARSGSSTNEETDAEEEEEEDHTTTADAEYPSTWGVPPHKWKGPFCAFRSAKNAEFDRVETQAFNCMKETPCMAKGRDDGPRCIPEGKINKRLKCKPCVQIAFYQG